MNYKLFIPSIFIGFFVLINSGFMGFLVLVVSFLAIAAILIPLYSEPTKYNHKKSKTVPKKNVSSNTKSDSNLVREENQKKLATLKQKNFLKELIVRTDYEVVERILITNKLINKLNMELASNIISHILKVENNEENKMQSDAIFFGRFPISIEKNIKLKCLGITSTRNRCTRIVSYPTYFCEIHSNDKKEFEFNDAISREYFYRSNCKKFLSSLFEFLTLESKRNNFKLEQLIKNIIKDNLGVKKFNNLIRGYEKKSFKYLFFDYTFFNIFTESLIDKSRYGIRTMCDECSIMSLKNNDLCLEHIIYSDFHLLYDFGLYPNESFDGGEFYLLISEIGYSNELIEDYYSSIKNHYLNDPMYGGIEYEEFEELFGDNE